MFVKAIVLSLALLLSGCSHWSTETKVEEAVYQSLSAVDAAQTIQGLRQPCYSESNHVLGSHPSPAEVVGFRALVGGIHFAVTSMLEDQDADLWVKRMWQGVFIFTEGRAVYMNWSLGATPVGATCP